MNDVITAALFAKKAHDGQLRKYTGTPYIWHPMRVAGHVLLAGGTEDMVCAAWLHDVIEDCDVHEGSIATLINPYVSGLVLQLTNMSKSEMPTAPRSKRKAYDREQLSLASIEAQTIKIFDRMDNLLEMRDAPEDFKNLYILESEALLTVLTKPAKEIRDALSQTLGIVSVN